MLFFHWVDYGTMPSVGVCVLECVCIDCWPAKVGPHLIELCRTGNRSFVDGVK